MMMLKAGSRKMGKEKITGNIHNLVNMESESERNNDMKELIFCP